MQVKEVQLVLSSAAGEFSFGTLAGSKGLPADRSAVEGWADKNCGDPPAQACQMFGAVCFSKEALSWMMATRPRTLALSITPVCVGTAVAYATAAPIRWPAVFAALLGSMLIQIGTNLHNDATDSEKGGDGPDRIGPMRVTSSGLLSISAVKCGVALSFAAAASIGLYLVAVGGWPILLLGLASIAAGWAYTGGPRPIAYTPFGELVVVAFFGLGAVCGTYWLSAASLGNTAAEAGLMLGLLSGAVLLVNNHRDATEDRRVGRRTLAILAGPQLTVAIYAALVLSPFALLPLLHLAISHGFVWLPLLALPAAVVLARDFANEPRGPGFNLILIRTVQLQVLFSALLCIGLIA
jgi:1,4-dihydroxy-2-naphthoate octaprenyltransferase